MDAFTNLHSRTSLKKTQQFNKNCFYHQTKLYNLISWVYCIKLIPVCSPPPPMMNVQLTSKQNMCFLNEKAKVNVQEHASV